MISLTSLQNRGKLMSALAGWFVFLPPVSLSTMAPNPTTQRGFLWSYR